MCPSSWFGRWPGGGSLAGIGGRGDLSEGVASLPLDLGAVRVVLLASLYFFFVYT